MSFLSTKSVSKTLKFSVHNSKKSSKRGISEIIGALILMGITVTGGVLVYTLIQGSEVFTFTLSELEISPIVVAQLIVTGYDTRDDASLYGITGVNNQLEPTSSPDSLCTTTGCTNGEFIILKIRNDNDESVIINGININEVEHVFDSLHTGGSLDTGAHFDGGGDLDTGSLPSPGEFIIVSGSGTSNLIQEKGSAIPIAGEKRFIIRLDSSITPNIALNSQIRVIIDSDVETVQELLIPAGSLA